MSLTPSKSQFTLGFCAVQRARRWARSFMLVVLVSLGTAGALVPSHASAATPSSDKAPTSDRVTFGIGPASATGADGRADFSFGATAGAVLSDHVALLNYSSVPLTLQLYARDAVETTGGGFGLLPASSTSHGVGAWISGPAGTGTEVVPPKTAAGPGQVIVPFTLRVPSDATPGDHVGGIIATLQTIGKNSSGQQIILDQRVATRVYVRVSGQIAPKVTVTGISASYDGTVNPFGRGSVEVRYVVTNAGNVDVAVKSQSISVSGLVADTRHLRVGAVPLLLPGTSVAETVSVPGVWPQVRLHAHVTVQPLLRTGTNAQLLASVSDSTSAWAVPWTLLVLIILVVGGLIIWRRLAKTARAARRAGVPQGGAGRNAKESRPVKASVNA